MTAKTENMTRRNMKLFAASNRPTLGRMLFAHTLAVLSVLGMARKDPAQRATVRPGALAAMIGASAIRHHSNDTGFLGRDDDGRVTLTDAGLAHFAGRAGRLGFDQRTDQIADGSMVDEMTKAIRSGGTVAGITFDRETEIAIYAPRKAKATKAKPAADASK